MTFGKSPSFRRLSTTNRSGSSGSVSSSAWLQAHLTGADARRFQGTLSTFRRIPADDQLLCERWNEIPLG